MIGTASSSTSAPNIRTSYWCVNRQTDRQTDRGGRVRGGRVR